MREIEIRTLAEDASAIVADAAAGETITITDQGQRVAQIGPLPPSRLDGLVAAGLARPALSDLRDLPTPRRGPNLSPALRDMRDDERY